MAQVTDFLSSRNGLVEFNINGAGWTDYSGAMNQVTPPEQARASGETYTLDGGKAIHTIGKREPMEIPFNFVYTEGASDLWDDLKDAFEQGLQVLARWSPKGGATGDFQHTTDDGYVTGFMYPPLDAGEGGPIMASCTLRVSGITSATVT